METIVKILMKRDGVSRKEATEIYEDIRMEIQDCCATNDLDGAEEALYEIGLELDYLMYFM